MAGNPEPFDSGFLQVDDIHNVYYAQYGRQDGKSVVFVHGGPGGRTEPTHTEFFDLNIFRVVLFDQRGAGKSTPTGEIRQNATRLLIQDIETIRQHAGIDQWHIVFGGSWGTALSLAYAQAHPEAVRSLILRGVCAVRQAEFQFSRGPTGAARIYPDMYERFIGHLPPEDRGNPIRGYYKLMQSGDPAVVKATAKEWNRWDLTISQLLDEPDAYDKIEDEAWSYAHAMLEPHYFVNGGFLEEGQLLREANISRIRHMRVSIVQGRYDIITAPQTAWDLHKLLPNSQLFFVQGAGHTPKDAGMTEKLLDVVKSHIDL